MDPYLTARSLSTPATLFAIACYLSGRPMRAAAWLVATALVHPQMGVYGALFIGCMALLQRRAAVYAAAPVFGAFFALPFPMEFAPAYGPARECLLSRSFFFISTWTWYQWIGVVAPLALLWLLSQANPRHTLPAFGRLTRALIPFGLVFTGAAMVLAIPGRVESINRLQPMRSFHLLYVILFLLLGGMIGEYWITTNPRRWAALFIPLAIVMVLVERSTYPASPHVEWPRSASETAASSGNSWISAFFWIRENTPKEAVFALDPDYMARAAEDAHGFRAVAERSVLADSVKDSGAVSLFPQLAAEWQRQTSAARGLDRFTAADFHRLATQYPVTWILTEGPAPPELRCPYSNKDLAVCKLW
jgi:hypothetical protein